MLPKFIPPPQGIQVALGNVEGKERLLSDHVPPQIKCFKPVSRGALFSRLLLSHYKQKMVVYIITNTVNLLRLRGPTEKIEPNFSRIMFNKRRNKWNFHFYSISRIIIIFIISSTEEDKMLWH